MYTKDTIKRFIYDITFILLKYLIFYEDNHTTRCFSGIPMFFLSVMMKYSKIFTAKDSVFIHMGLYQTHHIWIDTINNFLAQVRILRSPSIDIPVRNR